LEAMKKEIELNQNYTNSRLAQLVKASTGLAISD
jgi:hypothetical protein